MNQGDLSADALARVALSFAAEPGDPRLGAWVAELGAGQALDALRRGCCPLPAAEAYRGRVESAEVEAAVERAVEAAARIVVPGGPDWPTQLDDLGPAAPLVLWVRGAADLRRSALCSVAVVGARAASTYGVAVATELAAGLAERRWAVVSGGAFGIDAGAHRGAMAVDGVTVAVLANGIDEVYPRGNDALLARVVDTGVILTELPPGARPTRSRFLERNRVIAALSRGTVVVEAAVRSGALGTAARASALRRPVMGVPGPVTSATSAGVHALLRDQAAVLVRGVDDVLELVAPLGAGLSDSSGAAEAGAVDTVLDRLEPATRAVAEALSRRRPTPGAQLAVAAGVPASAVLGLLGRLAGLGLAERVDGGWRRSGP